TPTAQRGRAADEACPGILVRRRERPLEQLGGRNVADHGPTDTARRERTTARARTAAIGNRGSRRGESARRPSAPRGGTLCGSPAWPAWPACRGCPACRI